MKKVSSRKYFQGIQNYERTTGQLYGSRLDRSNPVSSNDKYSSQFTDYAGDEFIENYYLPGEQPEDNSPGVLETIWDNTGGWVWKQAKDLGYGIIHPGSAWNMFQEKRVSTNLTSSEQDLAKANINIKDLENVQDYINNINELKQLSEERANAETPEQQKQIENRMKEIGQLISKQNEYFATEGKKSWMLTDMFFDPEKADMTTAEGIVHAIGTDNEVAGKEPLPNTWNPFKTLWYDLKTFPGRLDALWQAGERGISKLVPKWGPDWLGASDRGNYTRTYIMRTAPTDRSTDKWFRDYREGMGKNIDTLQRYVDEYKGIYERDRKEAEGDVRYNLDILQNGAWFFDPKGIDPKYRYLQENRSYGLLGFLNPANLPYSFAELGSSWGDMEHLVGSMAVDAAIAYAAKKIVTKWNPYTRGASLITDGVQAVDALKNLERIRKAENFAQNVNFIGGALAAGSSVYFTKEMRRWETNSEAMDAWSNRVLNTAMDRKLNIDGILSRSDSYLNSIGIDTEGLDDIQRTQLALAYNSPTGDDDFEDLKVEARDGLTRLISSNNALAFMDYIQALPFMNYTKSFLRGFGSRGFRNGPKRFEDMWIAGDKKLREAIDPTLRAEFDRQVDRIAKKWIKNPTTQLRLTHGSRFLSKKAEQLFPLMTKEGIEEGQQYLLQQRYERGEYDGEVAQESIFSLPSLIDTGTLAADAVAGYIGINFGDPDNGDDELRKSMEIGAMTALWFRAPHAATNLVSDKTRTRLNNYFAEKTNGWIGSENAVNTENVRNLLAQFRNDKIIGKMVAENYGKNEDDEHVGLFFDSFSKSGVNRDRLAQSLEDFKKFKGPGVTDDFIEKDEKLLNTAWNVYNNQLTDSILEEMGVERNSSNHRNYVQLATRAIIDADNARQIFSEDSEQYKQRKQKFIDDAVAMLGELEDYEMFKEADAILGTKTYTESPNGKLAALVRKLSDSYEQTQYYRTDSYNKYTTSEKARQDAIESLKQEDKEFSEKAEGAEDRIAERIKETADARYNITKEDFVRAYMEDVVNYHMLNQFKKVRDLFKDREQLLSLVQKELGIDINYERLSGMIHELDKSVEGYKKRAKKISDDYNAILVETGIDPVSIEDAMRSYEFDMLRDMDKAATTLLINNALYRTLNTAANAYITGQSDPNNLRRTQRRPSWKELTQEQRDYYVELYSKEKKEEGVEEITEKEAAAQYNKERREYNKRMRELRKEYNEAIQRIENEDEEVGEDASRDVREIMEEAAKLYIESELQTKIDRKKIAHQEWLDERPALYDDFVAATIGNKQAEQKANKAVEETQRQEPTPESQPKPKKEEKPEKKDKKDAEEEVKVGDDESPIDADGAESGNITNEEKEEVAINDRDDESADTYDVEDAIEEGTINTSMSDDEKALRDIYSFTDPDEDYQNLPKGKKEQQEKDAEEATIDGAELESEDVNTNFTNSSDISTQSEESADLSRTEIDFDGSIDGENVPNKRETVTDHKVIAFNYIDQTFFYAPSQQEPPKCQIDGKPVKLLDGAELRSPAELAQKLSQPGWFANTKKYYIIAGDFGHVDMTNPDSLVVCLIIQDGKNAYATFMRSLGKKYKDESLSIPTYDREHDVIEKLRHQQDLPEFVGKEEEAIANRTKANKEGKRRAFLNHNPEVVNPTEEDINNWYSKASQDQRDDALDESRRIMAGGRPVHTERSIRQQIQKLRDARQVIIDACVQKGKDGKYILLTEGYKVVEPAEARISNGKINTQEQDGKHTFRKVTDGGFNMSSNTEELTQQLNNDEVEIGVGVGKNAPEGQKNTIVHINRDKQGSWDPNIGVGKSGKLYVITKAPSGNKVPVMLREARHDSNNPEIQPDQVVETIDQKGIIKDGQTPTIAEFIFRVLTHTFDAKQFGMSTPDPRLLDELLELLVNNGEDTIINKNDQSMQQYFAQKQLWFDARGVLHIALPHKNGEWKLTKLTKNQLFDPDYSDRYGHTSEENRRKVIAAIARNFHWNTERESLPLNMSTAYASLISFLRKQFAKDKNLKEYTFFGIKDLTFRRDDLFDENLKPKKVSHLAWMFASGKLLTDVGDQVFKEPFVFAQGTKSVAPSEEARYQAAVAAHEQNTNTDETGSIPLTDIAAENIEEETESGRKVGNIVERMQKYDGRETGFTPEEFGQHITNLINTPKEEAKKLLDEAGFEDAAILDVPVWYQTGEHIPDEELENGLISAIERYVNHYNKTHEKQIKVSDFKYNIRKELNQTPIWRSEVLPVIAIMKNGKTVLTFMDSMQIMHIGKRKNSATITGVYSSGRGGTGNVDANTARSWIQEAFGLTEDQLIITNAILKSTEGKEVFGVTQASADIINDEARVQFILSKNAGHGIQFHEAFHYVNLLLHNKAKRQQIYDNYRKHHLLRRNWSDEKIEEALAESFRRYAQMRTDRGILSSIKRMFNNVLDFAFQYRKRTLMRQIYDDILRGGYKGKMLDKESYAEFKKAYPLGAASMDANIPNVRRDITDKFQAINSYSKFYQCAESLSQAYIHFVLSQTVESTLKSGADSFQRFLDDLADRTIFGRSPYVQDILDNPVAFKYQILSTLRRYGIKGKTKSLKKYQQQINAEKLSEDTAQREAEDRYENTWDIDHFELSVKDNVAFRAKLFLSQIPKGRIDDVTRRFVPVEDELLGTQSYYSYDESWRLVMDNLSNLSTFSAIKKEVKRLAKTSAYFHSLNTVLDRVEGDIELENQLANAIKKQTATITFIEQSKPKQKRKYNAEEDDVISDDESSTSDIESDTRKELLDQDKQLDIRNDNTLGPLRSTLRSWSQFAYSNGLFRYSEKEKANVVSSKSAYDLEDALADIVKLLKKKSDKISEQEAEIVIQHVFPKLLDLLNKMGIPFDETVLNVYIDDHIESKDYGNTVERYNAIKSIIDADASKGGSIKFFVKLLTNNVGNTRLEHKLFKKNPRALYDLYNGYKASTEIGRMAKAYNAIHPNSSEHSVTVPGGKTMYPTNENNTMSDIIRWINENFEGRVDKMLDTPYAKSSIILDVARSIRENGLSGDLEFKLNLFVGMKDSVQNVGEDYFGITPLEDTISKMMMIHDNMFMLPTMADKKTYYAIKLISKTNNTNRANTFFEMPHDLLTFEKDSEDGSVIHGRFSRKTLDRFIDYFKDEINSLNQYYKRENIEALVRDPNKLKQNFHGNISNGRMDFSGNGGLFRYFYDILKQQDENGNVFNLNQLLEFAYKRQQIAEDPESEEGVSWFREGSQELDGFELVRRKLAEIEKLYFDETGEPKDKLYDDVNTMLFARVSDALIQYSQEGNNQLVTHLVSISNAKGGQTKTRHLFIPKTLPRQLLMEYQERFNDAGIKNYVRNPYSKVDTYGDASDLALSVIGNYVVGQMMSIIELEKVITGDPAFFKYTYQEQTQQVVLDGVSLDTRVLLEKDTDKIKRLGSVLSPGSELRTDYPPEVLAKYPELTSKQYTVANISDVSARSIYIDELKKSFGKQILADYIRNHANEKWVQDYINDPNIHIDLDTCIDYIYSVNKFYESLLSTAPKQLILAIEQQVNQSVSPYENITVADAEVLIRPALYRKIRIGLGQWSFTKRPIKYRDIDGTWKTVMYSDEAAFKILEEDGTWMSDPEKAALVSQFEGFPLKMSYFANDPTAISQENPMSIPVYNKMAIFPVFKYMFRSETGKKIYNRMNMEDNELDMIAFESAVKVGLDATRYSPYKKKTKSLTTLNDALSMKSDKYISKDDWSAKNRISDEPTMTVSIQNLDNIRMQLNTESHSDDERAIGTQMFKIMFSNIYDEEFYGVGTDRERKGSQIRSEIMDCINALTIKGVHEVKKQFYVNGGDKVDENKVRQYVQKIIENNGVGAIAEEIIAKGNRVASLMTRRLIEQSASALVNSEVIDIITNGGSAIQQSVFGFVSFDSNTVRTQQTEIDGYPVLNDGKELVWNEETGSMEVMLSMNFFKSVVPKKYQTSYNMMKWWLIENDIIKGFKSDGTISNPKPFGIGYRIPTQGLSSTFAFTVADVIPEQSGDVIIVPREFTAQTGSDFDVDKLFLATKSYKNGKLEETELDVENLVNASNGAIRNKMLQNYIDIVTDPKSFANARASIDVITDVIKNEVLVPIREGEQRNGYASSMYELTPQFQSRRKQEFSVGKQGIGPFALNITNLALTQYAHLTMDFGEDNMTTGFHFDDLDEITCEDENGNRTRISDWLSAMVNAHVDVAKDPYVFDLNVNQATYNHVNFLLRAGKGKSAFLFIAQPALKEYADEVNSSGGMYGSHIEPNQKPKSKNAILNKLIKDYTTKLDKLFNETQFRSEEQKNDWNKLIKRLKANDLEWYKVFNVSSAEKALKNPNSLHGLFFQVFALKAFGEIDKYAQALSNLVRVSKVDTKKFGNDLTLHLNFINSYNNFKYGESDVTWKLTTGGQSEKLYPWGRYSSNSYELSSQGDSRFSAMNAKFKPGTIIFGHDVGGRTIESVYQHGVKQDDWSTDDNKKTGKPTSHNIIKGNTEDSSYRDGYLPLWVEWANQNPELIEDLKQKAAGKTLTDKFASTRVSQARALSDILSNGERKTTTDALEHYFSSTFLDTKLFSAIGITRDILESQTYSATNIYSQVYNTIMSELFGYSEYEINGYVTEGYKEVLNEDIVSAIGTAIENIMRTKMLFKYGEAFSHNDGIDTTSDEYSWEEREKKNGYTGQIDFSFRGDVYEATKQVKRLFLGDKKGEDQYHKNSLFENIAALMERMKKNPTDPKYAGLVDPEGRVINELLNYLRPTPATEDRPIPRMLFSKSRIDTSVDEKSRLSSSFDFLLNHPNIGIRMLARDIALYAYYSTYDTNSSSSFFDLVPYDFRWQYDASLSQGLELRDQQGADFDPNDIMDIMCRNYYNDDNIVPLYNAVIGEQSKYINVGYGEYLGGMISDMVNKTRIPSVIVTSKTNAWYIKIRENGNTYLYKKVRKYQVFDKNKKKSGDPWFGYVLTEKLGRHAGTTHQYEFLATSTTQSMFEENEMPFDFDYETVEDAFKKFEDNSRKKLKGGKILPEPENLVDITFLRNIYTTTSHRTVDNNIDDSNNTQIIISDKPTSEYSTNDIDVTKSIDKIMSGFNTQSDQPVSISFSGNPQISVKKNMIDEYVDEQVSMYQGRIDPSTSPKIRRQMVDQFEQKVRSVAEENVRQRLLEDHILNIVSELELQGVNIESAYVSLSDPLQRAAYKVLYEKGIVESNNLFVISKEEVKNNQLEDTLTDEQLVISDSEELAADAVEEFIDNSINAQQELANEAETIRGDNEESLMEIVDEASSLVEPLDDPNVMDALGSFAKKKEEGSKREIKITSKDSRQKKIEKAKKLYGEFFDDNFDAPHNEYELVARNIGNTRNLAWTDTKSGKRGLQKELGLSRKIGSDTVFLETMLAKNGEGIGVDELVHQIYESEDNHVGGERRFSDQDIKNALLEIIKSAESKDDIINYDVNNRVRMAKQAFDAAEDDARAAAEADQDVYDNGSNDLVEPLDDPNVLDFFDQLAGISVVSESKDKTDKDSHNKCK